jgi:hypothetical protein
MFSKAKKKRKEKKKAKEGRKEKKDGGKGKKKANTPDLLDNQHRDAQDMPTSVA